MLSSFSQLCAHQPFQCFRAVSPAPIMNSSRKSVSDVYYKTVILQIWVLPDPDIHAMASHVSCNQARQGQLRSRMCDHIAERYNK
eukprot:5966-Eustigmatos_ZCMA.PRE.1